MTTPELFLGVFVFTGFLVITSLLLDIVRNQEGLPLLAKVGTYVLLFFLWAWLITSVVERL